MIRLVLWLLGASLLACGGAPEAPTASTTTCPDGQRLAVDDVGASHCVIPMDYVNAPPTCQPVACQAYEDWGRLGDGGAGAIACAAACEATCESDAVLRARDHAEAADAGMPCPW